ncbi:MAG: hypothetical protein AAGF30_02440 [Pseudomonadota bacterium]
MQDRDEVLLDVARLIWKREMSIAEFYSALGIDLDDVAHSDPGDVVNELAGVFKGWQNPPEGD